MAYELREGQGTLFKNKKKEQDKHPDYRGEINIGGTVYVLAAWIKESKAGDKFMSLSAQLPREREEPQKPAAHQKYAGMPDLDDLPF